MTSHGRLPRWPALLLALLGLGVLYRDALRTGFLNDDFLFLEEARTRPLAESLTHPGALANYYRPLSRQLYFAVLTPLADSSPLVFHLTNAALFAAALALLLDLLRAFLPPAGALAGALYFALLPLQRVNLAWVSCSQDLLALTLSLAAVALFRRRHDGLACLAYLGALASKESAFPLPAALAAWALWGGSQAAGSHPSAAGARAVGTTAGALARRMVPCALVAAAWLAVTLGMRARVPDSAARLHLSPDAFLAAWVHEIQTLLGLENPVATLEALPGSLPALIPLAALGALALWIRAPSGWASPPARRPAAFAAVWVVAFGLPLGPVVRTWSGYYYTLAAVGGALLVGHFLRRMDRWAWPVLVAGLLWWHAAATGAAAFAIADRPWGWTSHLTAFYFQRGAALCDTLQRQLLRLETAPPRGTRFFFATLPPWAGFQMGNGPLIRALYRDTSLAGHFYSQFSESTAADRPCRFLYWDGLRFVPLYGASRDPWFQVGSDLLLQRRPAGAAHAFRRGLAGGETRADHLYWLGWAELWRGRRGAAEAAWQAFGARDDPRRYDAALIAARDALLAADTLAARRFLFAAIRNGIGRPEAHGALGELLADRQLKYALLEWKAAVFLNPHDLRARRDLVVGLTEVRLDEAARAELAGLVPLDPGWARDSALVRAARALDERDTRGQTVARF